MTLNLTKLISNNFNKNWRFTKDSGHKSNSNSLRVLVLLGSKSRDSKLPIWIVETCPNPEINSQINRNKQPVSHTLPANYQLSMAKFCWKSLRPYICIIWELKGPKKNTMPTASQENPDLYLKGILAITVSNFHAPYSGRLSWGYGDTLYDAPVGSPPGVFSISHLAYPWRIHGTGPYFSLHENQKNQPSM